ncbi:MAG TPA: imidazole glycerol phosphate synthase subunit HisH [Methanotrichaceae archaeon]|nr:imidazole glycerol phosphate synthase subunit HisH [Methanotrichaceae archaeon]
MKIAGWNGLMIAIVDYGMGNLFSIYNAMARVSGSPEIVREPEGLKDASAIVVPGVGAFGMCMERLSRFGPSLSEALSSGTPILGICIGMQALFERSEESPGARGLGWIEGEVVRLPDGVMIPQMGWNNLSIKKEIEILDGIKDGDLFYFVHSYYCVPKDSSVVCATTEHGAEIAAAVAKGSLFATQFHPEKSGAKGLKILENFVRLTRC